MFCKHNWTVLDKTILKCEHLTNVSKVSVDCSWVFDNVLVVILQCKNCGRLKIVRQRLSN